MIKILTMKNCMICEVNKKRLRTVGLEYTEISADSEEGKALIKKHNIKMAGTMINGENIISVDNVLAGEI